MFDDIKDLVNSLDLSNYEKELMYGALRIHGHFCGAMPMGFIAGLKALETLDLKHENNMDLNVIVYAGDNHAAGCFVDGVQFSTGATFGKGLLKKEPKGKFQFLVIDKMNKKAVKIKIKNDVIKKAFNSVFIKEYRSKGVKPSDVPQEVAYFMFKNSFTLNNKDLLEINGPFDYDVKIRVATFNWATCEVCGDFVAENYVKVENGKKVCLDCWNYK